MQKIYRAATSLVLMLALVGCLSVRQQDLDSWVGQSVSMLDMHPLFMTVPMEKRLAEDGVEIRNYRNGKTVSSCSGNSYLNIGSGYGNSYANCFEGDIVCNNIFYIKDRKVLRYAPVGRCYTNESVRPIQMY